MITDSAYADALVDRLEAFTGLPDDPARDATSTWALTATRRLIARLDTARLQRPVDLEALTYLRNWTGTFESTSVAATLFTAWMASEAAVNRLDPASVAADSTFFDGVRRTKALQAAIDTLSRRFGPDLRQWRWEIAAPQRRHFPGYGVPGLDLPARRRYAALSLSEGGHPTALAYGPESADAPSTTYTFDVTLGTARPVRVRRFDYEPNSFLARFRLPLLMDPADVAPASTRRLTRLSPR